MPSFDIVSKVDIQTLDNAVNNAKKEILNRYDFQSSQSSIELEKKSESITIITTDDMRLKAIEDCIISRVMKQNIDPKSLDFSNDYQESGKMIRKEVKVREGIDKETAKKIIAAIKNSKLKVQASIMDDKVKVDGKKIDDLQAVISLIRTQSFDLPLQFINMRN